MTNRVELLLPDQYTKHFESSGFISAALFLCMPALSKLPRCSISIKEHPVENAAAGWDRKLYISERCGGS